ncbi:hypothetical protein AAG570_001291 [Ranatra chinensis]|uniref:[histone H3]-trimethyl-L-lysine(4) demethylase n=1 Tax=Ranatra chinensis TaxID=642074 RepID=A0ABD0YBQ1_9HEMI
MDPPADADAPKTTPVKKGKRKFVFEPPREAPIFTPTDEEFEDPLKYISEIRPLAETYGICKIIPPSSWKPPFALDFDTFKFTPRIQRINELEAKTRIKLNFLDQIAKFWAIQGSPLKIPTVGRNALDLYTLHRYVIDEGGSEKVSKDKKWNEIASKMGFPGRGSVLRGHYDHIIYPFYSFQKENINMDSCDDPNVSLSPKSKKVRELKSLQFLGAGPKMAVCNGIPRDSVKNKRTRGKKVLYNFDPLAKFICKNCCNDDLEESLVGCERCDDKYHTSCVVPPLVDIPEEGWKCPKCVAAEVCKPLEEFGFAQAQREYTLKQFGEMADKFKSEYFKMPCTSIPNSVVENEFWRVVSSIDEAVTVEYGADLHTVDHGSGFPKRNSEISNVTWEDIRKYSESNWNLNNFPVLKASALRHISADISGMKIPWVYVGMCFATFCWHNEDHWSYSINYLHWGEPKTWYGIPGMLAEDFEKAMKSAAPELFESQPDLLHQLVTTMNPNVAMAAGVPVCRTDQKAGEFVVTFPRAYHAGFNQGYNFAEACNFAPSDWLKIGRECISHYSSLRRYCVFSHDELLCKMAEIYSDLDERTLLATFKDFYTMLMDEKKKRRSLLNIGVSQAIREKFDSMPDDERQCSYCKTTCFLSALHCSCNESKLVCLDHFENLCECSPSNFVLRYHYRLDELVERFIAVKNSAQNFDDWVERVNNSFNNKNLRLSLRGFCELLTESKEKEFPRTHLIDYLEFSVRQCMEYAAVARVLVNRILGKDPKRNRQNPTVEELNKFVAEIDDLPCIIAESSSIKTILTSANRFVSIATKLIATNVYNKKRLESCINLGRVLRIDFVEMPILEEQYKAAQWYEHCKEFMSRLKSSDISELKKLCNTMPPVSNIRNINARKREITSLMAASTKWRNKALNVLQALPNVEIEELKSVLSEGERLKIKLPEREKLTKVVSVISSWTNKVHSVMNGETVLSLPALHKLLIEGKRIGTNGKLLTEFESHLQQTKEWKVRAENLFLNNSKCTLFEVLWPRSMKSRASFFAKRPLRYSDKPVVDEGSCKVDITNFLNDENVEISSLLALRLDNLKAKEDYLFQKPLCVCGEFIDDYVLEECYLCKTRYHRSCIFKSDQKPTTPRFGLPPKVLCSFCVRTKRPNYKKIIALLKSSQALTIKTTDVLLLDLIVNRIKNWIQLAQNILNEPEIKSSIATIVSNIQARREITEKYLPSRTKLSATKLPELTSDSKASSTPLKLIPDTELIQSTNNLECHSPGVSPIWQDVYNNSEISHEHILNLELVMMEGDLLEANIQESLHIWVLYQATKLELKLRFEASIPSPLCGDIILPKKKSVKRKLSTELTASEIPEPSVEVGVKRPLESEDIDPKIKKKIRVTNPGVGQSDSLLLDNEDAPEECASSSCLKPSDAALDWVQCDGKCGLWFHMRCVDLDRQDITEEDEYICQECSPSGATTEDEVEIPLETSYTHEVDPLL